MVPSCALSRVGRARLQAMALSLLLVLLAVPLGGCSVVDTALLDRTKTINKRTTHVRDDLILLNIARASRHEPMLFLAVSEYSGTGNMEGSVELTHIGSIFPGIAPGTARFAQDVLRPSARTSANANYKLAPLETQEFYAGFHNVLDTSAVHLLLNAGYARELVLHSIVKSVRVTLKDGAAYIYVNDPSNDRWHGQSGPDAHSRCEQLAAGGALVPPYSGAHWGGEHEFDCNYQKFLILMRAGLEFGITTEVRPGKAAGGKGDGGAAAPSICYDAAIAHEYGRKVHPTLACGSRGPAGSQSPSYGHLSPRIKLIGIDMRSAFGVFQYYGQLLATGLAGRVPLVDAGTARMPTGDRHILTVNTGILDCFARVHYQGTVHCVPNEGAGNTKQVFALLNMLVNLNTKRSSLPATSTVVIAP